MNEQSRRTGTRAPEITIQFATRKPSVPRAADIRRWVTAALQKRRPAQLTVRIVDETEGTALNRQWRGKSYATNVLSFPCHGLEEIAPELLGDIVICAPIVAHEAGEQGKDVRAHWAHMLVHGTLHLLGYNHEKAAEAERMESVETDILRDFGYPDPYISRESSAGDDPRS